MRNPLDLISSAYYNVIYGIQNLIQWFPVIWSDRGWDFFFIWILLHRKLYLMEKHIRKYSHHLHSDRDADQIKICVNLLKRLIDDQYHENVFMYHDAKWGKPELHWDIVVGGINGYKGKYKTLDITRDKVITKKDKKQEKKEFYNLLTKDEEQKTQDINYLFDYMKKRIQGWWD